MSDPLRFAEYMNQAMDEDEWKGERPAIGDLEWADKVIAYIAWLRFERRMPSDKTTST